jgi:hypothetical protein
VLGSGPVWLWQTSRLENALWGAHIRRMKNLALGSFAFVGAGITALAAAYLAHTVLGIPRYAIRDDALGMAACLIAFIGAGLFAQRRGRGK